MKKFAIAGSPVFHSKSPELFNYFTGYKNKRAKYSRICTDSAEDTISIMKDLNLSGINVTSPLKRTIIPFLDGLSPDAKEIKSVNTVLNIDGKYIGYNTDHIGLVKSLEISGISINKKKCLVIGAGGAGNAAVYGLLNAGGLVSICNRTLKNAEMISKSMGCEYIDISEINKEVSKAEIIVLTIPNDSDILLNLPFKKNQIILSADYKKELELNKKLEQPRIINGLLWLIFQGAASFKLFTEKEVAKIDIKKLQILLKRKHIREKTSLIGFSGSGKTTIAKLFPKINSVDIDEEIEQEIKLSIPEIFKKKGEQYFRNIERPILRKFILDSNTRLISCGGGILKNKKNSDLLANHTNIIWIWTPINIIKSRISDSSRPLLGTSEDLENLFLEREEAYLEAADMIIPNAVNRDGLNGIIELLKKEILS